MALNYISVGVDFDHTHMDALAAELDRKLAICFDNKTFLLSGAFPEIGSSSDFDAYYSGLVGNRFYFIGANARYFPSSHNYDHTAFVNGLASVAPIAFDGDNNLMIVPTPGGAYWTQAGLTPPFGGFFCHSLEAHTREGFSINEEGAVMPERRYKYSVAELIYDGDGFNTVSFPAAYNKFNHFRIHNLNNYHINFTFAGAGVTIGIPAFGIKTVSRNDVLTTADYDFSYKYLWRFRRGGPRFCVNLAASDGNFDGIETYAQGMAANNLTNPEVMLTWIRLLGVGDAPLIPSGLGPSCRFYLDPHEVYDIGSLYLDKFGDLTNNARIFGNALHHKGNLEWNDGASITRLVFNSYETIVADLWPLSAAYDGVKYVLNGAGTLTAYGTNLLNSESGASTPIQNLNAGAHNVAHGKAIAKSVPDDGSGAGEFRTLDRHDVAVNYSWNVYTIGSGVTSTTNVNVTNSNYQEAISSTTAWRPHVESIGTVLTLSNFTYPVTTNARDFLSTRLVLTPVGPQILTSERITITGSLNSLTGLLSLYKAPYVSVYDNIGGNQVSFKRAIKFNGYGWPSEWTLPFFSPRHSRKYSELVATTRTEFIGGVPFEVDGTPHPNITNDPVNLDGTDLGLTPIGWSYIEPEKPISMLCPATVGGPSTPLGAFRTWAAPDLLYGDGSQFMPRVPMLRENYNQIVAAINSIKKIKPMDYTVLKFEWGQITSAAGTAGILGSTLRPINQFAAFDITQDAYQLYLSLGIPIKTMADLPAAWAAAAAATGDFYLMEQEWLDTCTARTGPVTSGGFDHYTYTWRRDATTFSPAFSFTGTAARTNIIGTDPLIAANTLTEYYWVTIADVKAFVEGLGFIFTFQEFNVPVTIQQFNFDPPTVVGTDATRNHFTDTEQVNIGDPPTYSVGSTRAVIPTDAAWVTTNLALKDSATGEFKLPVAAYPNVTDVTSGDKQTLYVGNGITASGVIAEFAVDDPAFLLAQKGVTMSPAVGVAVSRSKYFLFQNHFTARLTDDSKAITSPVAFVDHDGNDFTGSSFDHGYIKETYGGAAFPLKEVAATGSVSLSNMANGDNVISFESGRCREIAIAVRQWIEA